MSWQEILYDSDLIYASSPEDSRFKTWNLKRTTCLVAFYEIHVLDDIDRFICELLNSNNGYLEELVTATILGFNVVDDFNSFPKRYADPAELEVFRAIIKLVEQWGLIEKITSKESPTILRLTDLGYRAIDLGLKYEFFSGKKLLLENFNLESVDSDANLFFPFFSVLGLYSDITNIQKLEYSEINVETVFEIESTDLIMRHKLQSKENYKIYRSEKTYIFDLNSYQVDIRVYKQGSDYYPIIFHNNQVCVEATDLLHLPENIEVKSKKIEWALYLKLIKDSFAVLNYQSIVPFEDLLELDSLVEDERLVWSDKQLFTLIAENANANQWYSISNHCPMVVLESYLSEFKNKLDWTSLSLRADGDFLIKNATQFPWNFEAISSREEISINILESLLVIPELKGEEWDWGSIMPRLDIDFIKSNIDKVDFELSDITISNNNEILTFVAQHPDKQWNWSYISSDYELLFILKNISNISQYLNIKEIVSRVFTDKEYVDKFCESDDFMALLLKSKETVLRDYSPNQMDYSWNSTLIDFLTQTGYLKWESGLYTLGFECNCFVEWDYNYFKKYHSKITTIKGFSFVSKAVTDARIILDFPDFNWNWTEISINYNLIKDKNFILKVVDNLNLVLLLRFVDSNIIESLFEKSNLLSFLDNNPESWESVTEKLSIEFIRKHISYDWDWLILTKRFCSTIKIEALGNAKWIEKWDWRYLTQNLDTGVVIDNIDLYVDYWDWNYLSSHLDKNFILNNLPEYNGWWNWDILLNERLGKEDLLLISHLSEIATCISVFDKTLNQQFWQIITEKFDYIELEALVEQTYNQYVFRWDYDYFYNLPNFNPRQYLEENHMLINWESLSRSQSLNKSFKLDESLFSYKVWIEDIKTLLNSEKYSWNFESLSRLDNINWNNSILNIKKEKWDWDYLSEFSSCFKDVNFKGFETLSRYLNFKIFSKRTNSNITEDFLSENINKPWDWKALSANKSIHFSYSFIQKQSDKPWDWQVLSARNDIEFDNDTIISLSDKNWDWHLISLRNDIEFSNDLIIALCEKSLDWKVVSQNRSFVPNSTTLSLLKGENLDWLAISQNEKLSTEVLWDYKEYFDWKSITKNSILDLSNLELLKRYKDYLDWSYISKSDKFDICYDNLVQFKDKLYWKKINERLDKDISEEMLEPFIDVLNWSNASQSMKIHFTEELIEKFRSKWDWQFLRNNPRIIDGLENILDKYKSEFNTIAFLDRFDETPFIYHFTHLFNAIDIIKNRKILSRNKANGKFSNAAGNLVDRRVTAHGFARFYYRPQTPTQFYNECLGMDSKSRYYKEWNYYGEHRVEKTYYSKAESLGLPKCPIPVFFKFDLKEVLMKMPDKCYYSTGNMQSNDARVEKITDNPNGLNTRYLYSDISDFNNYKQFSQQEFLVYDDFDFSDLDSFEIICYNKEYENLLKSQLPNDLICKKINSNNHNVFHKQNRELNIQETDSEVFISSEYRDSAYLSIKGEGLKCIQILNPNNIQKETTTEIIAYPEIRFTKTEQSIEVHFVDTMIGVRDWLVYKN